MSQVHKTPFFVQHAIAKYIEANKSFPCSISEGMNFEELDLPIIGVVVTSQESKTGANGPTGNKVPTVSIILQTSYEMSNEQHWDLWAEIEDLFNLGRATVLTALNNVDAEIAFNNMEIGSLVNAVNDEIRKTIIEITFLTNIRS